MIKKKYDLVVKVGENTQTATETQRPNGRMLV